MASNASEYAESVGRGFWAAHDAGAVFGWQECAECGASPEDTCEEGCEAEREPASAGDYLADVLDIEYVISSRGDYKGAEILLSFGGPNAWIDTRASSLVVAWGSERASWALPGDMIDALDEILADTLAEMLP